MEKFIRTEMLFGKKAMQKLSNSNVILFGLGGVGGNTAETLVRSGIQNITLVDNDTVDTSNINRQIFATTKTVGMDKTEAAYKRLKEINPRCNIRLYKLFYLPETSGEIDFGEFDYIIDAIDTLSGKIEIIMNAKKAGVPVISSMGTGNKLDPTQLTVTDIYKTEGCPLARVMRRELKKRGVDSLKVVYSKEKPNQEIKIENEFGRPIPASCSFVPPVAGIIIAGEVIKDLIQK